MGRQRGLRISTATVSITLMWSQYGHGVVADHSVSRPTTALPPFFVRTLPDPQKRHGLCYDTHHVWAVTVTVTIPDKLLHVLRGGFIRKKRPYKPLAERFRRKFCLLEACIQEKKSA
jgi:hypothetical protein